QAAALVSNLAHGAGALGMIGIAPAPHPPAAIELREASLTAYGLDVTGALAILRRLGGIIRRGDSTSGSGAGDSASAVIAIDRVGYVVVEPASFRGDLQDEAGLLVDVARIAKARAAP